MATRRFRIKAVANVSVSRGRCGEKPRENEKLDEKTLSNSSTTSDSHEVNPSETKRSESVTDITLVEKLSDDSSSKELLENSLVNLVQESENVSGPTCWEAIGNDSSSPVDTPSGVSCNMTQYARNTVVQQSGNCVAKESRLCNTTDEGIKSSTGEHCLKAEEIIESVKSGDSCVASPQKIDTPENKIPSPPIRLPRKRVKPTVSVSLVNRKAKENSTLPITQQCSSSDNTLENVVASPLAQNSGDVSLLTPLEGNDNDRSTPVATASVIDHHLSRNPASGDLQQSGDCDTKDVSLYNKTNENITASINEIPSTVEESIKSTKSEDSCVSSGQTVNTTGTKIPAATIRLPRKRVKPAVSLSVINRVKENLTVENAPVCHSVQNSANDSESTCSEETNSGRSTPMEATSVVSCNLTQDPGYDNIQQSDSSDSKDVSTCNRTNENITASSDEHCSKTEESIGSMTSDDSFASSAQVIDTLETKIPAAPVRLPRKRVKPAVSLSVINRVKENLTLENTSVCHSVENSANDSEPTCLEETDSGRSTPMEATSVVACNLTQAPGYDNIQQPDSCDSKDMSICDRTNENIILSSGEHCSKAEESVDSFSSEDSFSSSAQVIDTLETKIPAAPIRLPRKRVKPAVSLSLVNKKVKENLLVESKPDCHSVENSSKLSEPTCLEENYSDHSSPVGTISDVACNLTPDTGYADIQKSDNSDSQHDSICNRTNEDIKASNGEHCSKTEESIDSVSSEDSFSTCAQKIDTLETKIPAAPIRLPRKRVKPAVSLSLVNKKVKENLTVESKLECHSVENSSKVSEPICLEENGNDHSTPVDATSKVTSNFTQDTEYADIQQSDNCDSQEASLCNRTNDNITASSVEHCSETENSIDSGRSEDLCASSAQKIDTIEIKIPAAPITLPRKRMKPTVSLSSVNKKVKENCTVELTRHGSASRIDDDSTVHKKMETSESSSELHEDVGGDGSVRTIPAVGSESPSSAALQEIQKSNDSGIVPQTCVETCVLQENVCEPERKNEVPRDISVGPPVGERSTSTVSVSRPTCDSNVTNESPVVGKDKRTSPPVKCPVNQLVKDCSPLNSFRSRFVRPKPLLESAARRNRTGSIGSASESDSEKKSLSSATTVSPPWKPKLKTSRNRLTHLQALETDKLANASNASTDESEDERSSISRAPTISPPKKITRLDSGSDTSHSEFSQDLSEDNSSPVKKSTKPEWISKRREYLRRIIEIKKEISHKVGDGRVNKSRLTMFDLIYYNPVTNPMKSAKESSGVKSTPAPITAPENENRLAEESVDEPEALEDEEQSSTVPVPQVKVGPNGEIILDEQSLVIETTDAKKNWNDLQNSEVIMDYGNGTTTFNAYSKKRRTRTKDWNREETLRFYRALHTVGTDFLVMQSLFPKFTRKELKDRYKKEEKINRELVEKALRNPLTFDLTELQKEFELERLEEEKRLTQPKKRGVPKRKGGFSRSCSLFATLDSTDQGNTEKPVKRKRGKVKDFEETNSQKRRKTDDTTAGSECKPNREETNSKSKRKTGDTGTAPECTSHREETNSKKKRKAGDAGTPHEDTADRKETHSKKKRKIGDTRTPPECINDSEATRSKKRRKAGDARAPSVCPPESDASNALNGHIDVESNVPEAVSQIKPTRSGRIPRPRIFEDFMTDDVEEIYEETEITEICERVTVEDVCDSEPVGNELVESEDVVVDEDTVATYESENEDQNFVIAEDALTVQQSQVNLGSVYSNVKPGTLIVLATESPDNPGHQIFRVFMVSNNSQTLPVSVPNNQALPAGTSNSVETSSLTNPVVSESSTNDCNSLQMSAESSS